MYGLRFDGERCPDGVEVFRPEKSAGTIIGEIEPELFFRNVSETRHNYRLELTSLSEPVVAKFIEAKTPQALARFFGDYGLLDRGQRFSARDALIWQDIFNGYVQMLNVGRADNLGRLLNAELAPDKPISKHMALVPCFARGEAGCPPVLTFQAPHLLAFMMMEIVMMAAGGAQLGTCESCGDRFVIGAKGGRTIRAKYCSDTCRVRANRARKAFVAEQVRLDS